LAFSDNDAAPREAGRDAAQASQDILHRQDGHAQRREDGVVQNGGGEEEEEDGEKQRSQKKTRIFAVAAVAQRVNAFTKGIPLFAAKQSPK